MMPRTKLYTVARRNAVTATLVVEHDSPQTGRADELRLDNQGRRSVRVKLARAAGKGRTIERTFATGLHRVSLGTEPDERFDVTVERDGRVKGAVCTLEFLPLEETSRA